MNRTQNIIGSPKLFLIKKKAAAKRILKIIPGIFIFFAVANFSPASGQGTVLFNADYETGTMDSGIPGLIGTSTTGAGAAPDAAYMVQPGATGNWAIAHKIVQGDSSYYHGNNFRTESDAGGVRIARFKAGDELRYEFSLLLKDWVPWEEGQEVQISNVFQTKTTDDDVIVPLMVRTLRNSINIRFTDRSTSNVVADYRPYINQYMHFRIDVKWSTQADGYFKVYVKLPGQPDYVLMTDKPGMITYPSESLSNFGRPSWGVYGGTTGFTRIVYHDDIRIIQLAPPLSEPGLIWGNSIIINNPATLDGPYTEAANLSNRDNYNITNSVYLDENLQFTPSQNITASPFDPSDNVVGTPYSDFSRATLVQAGNFGGRYLISGWSNGTTGAPSPFNADQYYEFKLEPRAGATINFDSVLFTVRRGATTAPGTFALRSSIDGFSNNIGGIATSATTGSTTTLLKFDVSNLASLSDIGSPITFRLYGYGATGSGSSVGIDEFRFYGLVTANNSLPVTFGSIKAVFENNGLRINWATLSETNSSHFEIQASRDGQHFATIKTIQTKNGNSSLAQNYEAIVAAADMAALISLPMLLGFLGFGAKRKMHVWFLATMVITVIAISCSKYHTTDLDAGGKMYVRIKQVDVDGTARYSKIILANSDN